MSLRWRLQAWHALILIAVLAVFGTIVFYLQRQTRWQQIDAELHRTAGRAWLGVRRPFPGNPWSRYRPPRAPADRAEGRTGDVAASAASEGMPPEPRGVDEPQGDAGGDESGSGRRRWPSHRRGHWGPPEVALSDETQRLFEPDGGGYYYVLWDEDGDVLEQSTAAPEVPFLILERSTGAMPRELRQRGEFREIALDARHGTTLLVGRSLRDEMRALYRFVAMLASAGLIVLAVGLAGGWWLSGRAIRPIEAISATAERISGDNLNERIDVRDTDSELGRLAAVLNATFDRLENAVQQQVRLTADASHELRTPLSVLLANSELALAQPRSSDEYRAALETCTRAALRMKGLVESLLTLSRFDSGEVTLQREAFDLGQSVRESVELLQPLAQERGITIQHSTPATTINGDPQQTSQVITNLLTNAIRYNRDGGRVDVSVASANGRGAVLEVSDTGPGIPPEDLPHIFERFYRVDKARARSNGGNGLGLAICQTIVEAHHGTITVRSIPEEGTTFEVRLP